VVVAALRRRTADDLRTCPVLWTVTVRETTDSVHTAPTATGSRLTDRWQFGTSEVLRYGRQNT
jgi:hypothetical protein